MDGKWYILNSIEFRDKLYLKLKSLSPNGIINNVRKTVSSYLKQCVLRYFEFECVGLSNVENVMRNLAPKNSSKHYGISARFLKKILAIVTPPLTHIVNQSLFASKSPKLFYYQKS